MRGARIVLMVAVCSFASLAAGADDSACLPYSELAENALHRAGMEDASPHTFRFERFLESGFLHTRLGLYDLYLPAGESLEPDELEDYREMALALLDAQRGWLDWLSSVAKGTREAQQDLKRLRSWAESWKIEKLLRATEQGQRETLEALDAKSSIRLASDELAGFMGSGAALSLDRSTAIFEPLILIPDRERFVEVACLGGWLYPGHRRTFWNRGITDWTHLYIDQYQFLSLELTDPNRSPRDWRSGIPMDYRNPDAAAQQVVQLAIGSLLDNYYGSRIPPSLAGALSVNLVIEIFGECDTRADGDLRSRRTEAYEIFVPGGRPEGGVLPPRRADSRWREGQGDDHFVSLLRQAQKKGAVRAGKREEKHPHFELVSDSGSSRMVVTAPFLGEVARNADRLPPEFCGDWLEFLRSYRSCFLWWLQSEAERSKKSSAEAFAALLLALAEGADAGSLPQVFSRTYDVSALSSDEPGKQDLEGRFLRWLAKQR